MNMVPGRRFQNPGDETGELGPGVGLTSDIPEGTTFEVPGGPGAAGGFDPTKYKLPKDFGTPDAPYVFTTEDAQGIPALSTVGDIIQYNTLLMKAFPGYKPGTTLDNRFDSKFRSQFYTALSRINVMNADPNSPLRGKSVLNALAYLAENPIVTKPIGGGLSRTVSNPDDLKRVFTQASQSVLGRTLNEVELNRMVSSYQGIQAGSQTGQAGTRVAPPSAETFAMEQARQAAPVEAKAMEYVDYIGELAKLMAQ